MANSNGAADLNERDDSISVIMRGKRDRLDAYEHYDYDGLGEDDGYRVKVDKMGSVAFDARDMQRMGKEQEMRASLYA